MSIQDRIASLNLGHVRTPGDARPPKPKTKPALPPRLPPRSAVSTQDIHINAEDGQQPIGNQPARATPAPAPPQRIEKAKIPLAPPRPVTHEAYNRRPSAGGADARPPLPTRNNASNALVRRNSNESIASTLSTKSSVSGLSIRTSATAPSVISNGGTFRVPAYDPISLPPLPPKRSDQQQQRPALRGSLSSGNVARLAQKPPVDIPPLPPPRRETTPALPPRPPREPSENSVENTTPSLPAQPQTAQDTTMPGPRRSALSYGMNKPDASSPPPANRLNTNSPPPIPASTRPNLAALQASKPAFTGTKSSTPGPTNACLKCRDFSGPDSHAARFPRKAIPPDVTWLAHSLTSPFPSHTDKARALFTWCHHNINYNAHDFFNGSVKPSTPQSTLETGLAVCEGYAALFNAMALAVGLESVVIGGHGMGFSKKPIGANEPTPPENASGHAWNVVKTDGNEWKLIDVCWGAGHLEGDQQYHRKFHPERFTQSNDDFGLDHFPKNPRHQFRNDGRSMSWDEYIRGPLNGHEKLTVYTGCADTHGIAETSFQPRTKHIRVRGVPPTQRVRFMFSAVCEHWDPVHMGKGLPYQYVLAIGGRDGRIRKNIPFMSDGRHWWLDTEVRELGCVGQSVHLYAVTNVNGADARGLTLQQYEKAAGSKAMGFGGVACWQLQ